MKKRFIYSFCVMMAASVLLPSCKKEFLDTAPTDAVSTEVAFTNTVNARYALNGIYRAMYLQYANQDEGGESSVMIDMDMMGEDVVNRNVGNGWFRDIWRYITSRSVNGSQTAFVYRYYYKLISNANAIITNIDAASGPEADKKAIKGEALAIRAFAHFKLVQIFAQRYDATTQNTQLGVPLNITTKVEKLPRSTVAAVYTQINKDIDDAITNLTGATARTNKSHFNLNVAQGLKARVALVQQNYAVAADMAAKARVGFPLMSTDDYKAGFNNYNNNEWIWGITQIADQGTFFYSFFAYMSVNFNSTNIRGNPKCINSALYNQMTATDIRRYCWDPTGTDATLPVPAGGSRYPYMNRKFLSNSSSNSYGDLVFMRASEMYLIEAEAKARLGNDAGAQDALFPLAKQRDASYVKSTKIGTALIDEIMIQRRIELWGEGFRFLDLKRLNQPLDRTNSNHDPLVSVQMTIPAGDVKWQWLFPQAELNSNDLIIQNPIN